MAKPLNIDEVRKQLESSVFGRNIVFQPQMDSTHTLARRLAGEGAPEGTLVVTDEQLSGRGRMGRRWVSPACANLMFSVVLRPTLAADQVFVLTMTLALSAVDAVQGLSGVKPVIKWPNDIYAGGAKLGGILTEVSTSEKAVESAVLGLGLNVSWCPRPGGLPYAATSLRNETGKDISREKLLSGILLGFEAHLRGVLSGDVETIYRRWNRASMLLGERVRVRMDGEVVSGIASRIERDGSLIVKTEADGERRVLCGDVSLRAGTADI